MKRLFYYMTLLVAVLLTACSSDETTDVGQPLPEGMGRIRITICTPESVDGGSQLVRGESQLPTTRAVNTTTPWEVPDHEWEKVQTFRIFICDASYKVVQIIEGGKDDMDETSTSTSEHKYQSATVTSEPLEEGTYYIFATANYADGLSVGATIDLDETIKPENGYSYSDNDPIPMTGKLTTVPGGNVLRAVGVSNGTESNVTDTPLTLWRVVGKMQFYFTNESEEKIRIIGIEVYPLHLASDEGPGIYLFSKDDLTSEDNLAAGTGVTFPPKGENTKTAFEDVGTFRYQPEVIPLTLDAKGGNEPTGTIYFYVNESDGTFTMTNNQLSLRFRIQRQDRTTGTWYDQEIRYGVTTHYGNGSDGQNGFNVIRRNDWIHIPVVLTDWQLRIEPIAFVPIAGYPAKTVDADGLTATFSTGGFIALQPFVKKYDDPTWRDFSNPEVSNISVSWKNSDGKDVYGDTKIVKSQFVYDSNSRCVIGELNNGSGFLGHNYMTTFTVNVTLGPPDDTTRQYNYSFTFNVILQ